MIDSEILLLPFLTTFRDNPDYNQSDEENEANSLIIRNTAIQDYLEGNKEEDYLFDLLAQEGIEPNLYINAVEEEIEYFIANPHELYT